ncbi:hypothetical protein ACFLTJ_03700 [Chloroflexota bacterium]
MLVAICTNCSKRYVGWALSEPDHQNCDGCGARLIIRNMNAKYDADLDTMRHSLREEITELKETTEKVVPRFYL